MKQIGPDGDLIFSSTEFGSGSVTKTEQIAKILEDLLSNITLTMKSEDTKLLLEKYYMKTEIDEMLTQYVKINQLAEEVAKQLTDLMNDPEFSGKYASQADLQALNKIVTSYSETISTILGNQQSIQTSWTEYKQEINNRMSYQDSLIEQQNTIISDLRSNYNSLSSTVSSLQNTLSQLGLLDLAQFSSQITEINAKLDKIGDLANLKTTAKDTLVSAINELIDTRGDLTTLKTTAKGSLVASLNELFQSASDGKSLIAAAITGKGVDAAANDTFAQLATKITSINTGYNTSDANITAADIVLGKVGYGKNGRLVGEHVCEGGGGTTPIADRVVVFDSSENYYQSGQTVELYSGGAGVLVPTLIEMMCINGDDVAHGDAYYVIDGVENNINNYNEMSKITFSSSISIRVGTMTFDSSGTGTCDYCGDSSPVLIFGGVLIKE